MATPEGDVIRWDEQPDGSFLRDPDVASHHLKLQRTNPTTVILPEIHSTELR
jgi:hypothetical protein